LAFLIKKKRKEINHFCSLQYAAFAWFGKHLFVIEQLHGNKTSESALANSLELIIISSYVIFHYPKVLLYLLLHHSCLFPCTCHKTLKSSKLLTRNQITLSTNQQKCCFPLEIHLISGLMPFTQTWQELKTMEWSMRPQAANISSIKTKKALKIESLLKYFSSMISNNKARSPQIHALKSHQSLTLMHSVF